MFSMNLNKLINSSTPEYWDEAYRLGNVTWDLGFPTPVFNNWINHQKVKLSICVVGAGNGWDAINFAKKGHNVTAVDFALSAISNMRSEATNSNVKLNILHSDIFDLNKIFQEKFDIVLEYTCYCAIDPSMRKDYISIVNTILKPRGKFVALLFPLDKEINEGGPPYGVSLSNTLNLFDKYFLVDKYEYPVDSIEARKGREIFITFNKHGH